MDEYLQHLRSLGMQLRDLECAESDQEAKEDALAAEEYKCRAAIAATEMDLQQVHADLNLNIAQLDNIKRDGMRLSEMTLGCRNSLQRLDAEAETLEHDQESSAAQAFELLRTDIRRQVIAVGEKRSFYDAHIDEIVSKKQEYENCYKAGPLAMEICQVQAELEQLTQPLMTPDQPSVSEPRTIMRTGEPEKAEDLVRDVEVATAEYGKEHEYLETLKGQAKQLQVPRQIVCRSCGHAYGGNLRAAVAKVNSPAETGGTSNLPHPTSNP